MDYTTYGTETDEAGDCCAYHRRRFLRQFSKKPDRQVVLQLFHGAAVTARPSDPNQLCEMVEADAARRAGTPWVPPDRRRLMLRLQDAMRGDHFGCIALADWVLYLAPLDGEGAQP